MDEPRIDTTNRQGRIPAVARLRQAARAELAAQAGQAAAIWELARAVGWDESAEYSIERARLIRIGADGTRLIDEDVALEVAGALRVSVDAAVWLVRDIVNLAARLPHTWQAVQTGRLPLWRARDLAQRTELLTQPQAVAVDQAISAVLGNLGWRRVTRLVTAAMLSVAPDLLAAQAAASRAARYVRTGMLPDDPASSWLAGKLDTAAARDLDHLLDQLAHALIRQGRSGDRDHLRAHALGLISSDLGEAVRLLAEQPNALPTDPTRPEDTDPTRPEAADPVAVADAATRRLRRHRPSDRVYVHLNAAELTADGIADVERVGPALVEQVRSVLGDRAIRLAPVVHAGPSPRAVDAYPIPRQIREDVLVRDRVEMFPYSSRNPRSCDLDHTTAWVAGASGQTRPDNLGPLSRRAHRAKTHDGWKLEQPRPGIFWWTTPAGQTFRISSQGTWDVTPDDPDGGHLRHTIWRHLDANTDENGTWHDPP